MQLLKLEVRNWVHHRQRTCEFTRGLVAILGENGSGKSSLFGAIRWALTGENPFYGVKADNISQYAKEGEPSYVSLEFEHNGHIAVVTRYLRPEKEPSILLIDGTEQGRGDKAVTAGIEKLLGVDAKFISRFVIVGQTDIFSFIDDKQSDTDKFFQRLFNTAAADKCQDVIGKALTKITLPEIAKPSSQLALELKELRGQMAELQKEIDALPAFDDFLRLQKTDQEVLKKWEARQKAAAELNTLGKQAEEYQRQLDAIAQESDQQEKDLEALVSVTSGQESAHAAARTALGHWQSYKSISSAKERLAKSREELQAKRAANPEPPAVAAGVCEEIAGKLANFRKQLKEFKSFVNIFVTMGNARCPTCNTPTTDLKAQLKKAQEIDIPQVEDLIAYNEKSLAEHQALDAAHKAWEKLNAELRGRETQLDEAEAKLVAVAAPPDSEDVLRKTVDEYDEFVRVKAEIEPLVREAREKKAKLAGTLDTIKNRRAALLGEIGGIAVTEADAKLAETRLTALREQVTARQNLEQQMSQLLFDSKKLQEQHELVRLQETSGVKTKEWITVAEQAREALKNAPRLVAQRNLLKLESSINEILQIFGVNFVVHVSGDDMPTFVADFFDGRQQVAQRLSIGQKTVLALAFRVAVNAMFAEEIGLLALDEPTASLDSARIRALAPVLDKLRDLSTAKGLQCLLVTHATTLSHLFESAIELDAPESRHVSQH